MKGRYTMSIITNSLQLKNLFPTTAGGTVDVEAFAKVLEDGSLKAMIQECADAMHGGNIEPVVKRMIENCQSKVCTDKNRVQNTVVRSSSKANEMLLEYLKGLRGARPVKGDRTGLSSNRAKWDLTHEEVESIQDYETLRKIRNCMASHKSKDLSGLLEDDLTEKDKEFLRVYEFACERLKTLKVKGNQEAKQEVMLSEDLLAKLQSGKAATLSKAQVAELLKVLGK